MNRKLKLIILVIFILGIIILAIYPRDIGNDNPLMGLVYSCFGYKFKKVNTYWSREGSSIYSYYCLGIPYDYEPSTKCFSLYLIKPCHFGRWNIESLSIFSLLVLRLRSGLRLWGSGLRLRNRSDSRSSKRWWACRTIQPTSTTLSVNIPDFEKPL